MEKKISKEEKEDEEVEDGRRMRMKYVSRSQDKTRQVKTRHDKTRQDEAWYGMVWYGMARYGMAWFSKSSHLQLQFETPSPSPLDLRDTVYSS